MNLTPQDNINKVEEWPQNMYCISSATEIIIMKAPQKMPVSACSATLAYNMIYIIKKIQAPSLDCIFYDISSFEIF